MAFNTDKTYLNILDFGADPSGSTDSRSAIMNAIDAIQRSADSPKVLKFPSGIYRVDSAITRNNADALVYSMDFIGESGTIIRANGDHSIFNLQADDVQGTPAISSDVTRSKEQFDIDLTDTTGAEPGRLLFISDNDRAWESNWSSKAVYMGKIRKVSGSTVTVDRPIHRFDLVAANDNTIAIYREVKVSFKNIAFETQSLGEWQDNYSLNFRGMQVVVDNVEIKAPLATGSFARVDTGMRLGRCYDSSVTNIRMEGLGYGINFQAPCRNVYFRNLYLYKSRHAIIPGVSSENILAEYVYGYDNNSTMDSHAAFDVTYRNWESYADSDFANCRAMGNITIENCKLYPKSTATGTYSYFTLPGNTVNAGFEYIVDETDVIFKNVTYIVQNNVGQFSGLGVASCRNFYAENCISHMMGTHQNDPTDDNGNLVLVNCKLAHLQTRSRDRIQVTACEFDGALSGTARTDSAVRSPAGANEGLVFDNCTFHSYDSATACVFNTTEPDEPWTFINCRVDGFLDFAGTYNTSGEYNQGCIINSKFVNFTNTPNSDLYDSNKILVVNPNDHDIEILADNGHANSSAAIKYVEVIPSGSITSAVPVTVTHQKATRSLLVSVFNDGNDVEILQSTYTIDAVNNNSIEITFPTAPGVDVRIVIL